MTGTFYEQYALDHRGDPKIEAILMNKRRDEANFQAVISQIIFDAALDVLGGESTEGPKAQT